jgi:LysM repeat protein
VVCVVAFLGVIVTTTADDGDDASEPPPTTVQTQPDASTTRPQPRRRFYRVKVDDTLDGIAERTGIDAETLQELNPNLDPQALAVGQRIKLRE